MGIRIAVGDRHARTSWSSPRYCAMILAMQPSDSEPGQIVERNPDGTFTKETLQRAMKALKKRLKVTRLDDESSLGRDPMSKGGRSSIVGVVPPLQYPAEVWQALEQKGRLRATGQGSYQIVEQPNNPAGS